MSQEQAFLGAIIEAPDNDVHRLVYADWLDETEVPLVAAPRREA
ncbi:MAG TPA: TIGR02996 domain-containing protein [Gemmataceae bacterium]|nr:TIGR02996 domain-containing protein [Gemmataceae bacterium]